MLNTIESTCPSRKQAWEAHFKTRANEVTAISEAIAILNDDDALEIFKKAAPALMQGRAMGFLQSRRSAFQALENLRLTLRRSQISTRAAAEYLPSAGGAVALAAPAGLPSAGGAVALAAPAALPSAASAATAPVAAVAPLADAAVVSPTDEEETE